MASVSTGQATVQAPNPLRFFHASTVRYDGMLYRIEMETAESPVIVKEWIETSKGGEFMAIFPLEGDADQMITAKETLPEFIHRGEELLLLQNLDYLDCLCG